MAYDFLYKDVIKKAQEAATIKAEVLAASQQTFQVKNMETTYQNSAASRALLPTFLVSVDNAVPFIDAVEAIGPATTDAIHIIAFFERWQLLVPWICYIVDICPGELE